LAGGTTSGGNIVVNDGTIEPAADTELADTVMVAPGSTLTVTGSRRLKLAGNTAVNDGSQIAPDSGTTVELTNVTGIGGGEEVTLGGQGTVVVNDTGVDATGGTVKVDGATLMGVGPIAGNLLVTSGAHSPGNSIGTQTVTGTYTLANGAVLKIEIDGDAGQKADLVDVTGNAVLENGSKIQVIQADGSINTGDTFTVIQTTTGIADAGVSVESLVSYEFSGEIVDQGAGAKDYVLTATSRPFTALATGSNQMGIARALDAMGDNALTSALGNLPEGQFAAAVQQLDAAPHIAPVSTVVPAVTTVNGHVAGRLASLRAGNADLAYLQDSPVGMTFAQAAQDPAMLDQAIDAVNTPASKTYAQADGQVQGTLLGWRPFVKTYGTFSEHDTTDEQTGYDADTVGFVAGVDTDLGDFTKIGFLAGYSYTDVDFDLSRGESEVHTLRVGPYATFDIEDLFIDASITMGYHWNEGTRKVRIGSFSGDADSDYNAWDLALYGGVGYDFDVAGFTVTPSASLQWVHFEQESFRESGGGAANLDVDSWDTDSLRHVLALKVSRVFETETAKIVPEVYMGWGHEYLEDDKISSKFVGQTTPFTFESDADNQDSMLFGAGVSFLFNENLSVFFRYDGDVDSDQTSHTVSAGLKFSF
jgi:outer membrane autotransporter protein